MIIKGQDNQMTDDEIQKRMEELSYLKIQPRDLEENRLVLSERSGCMRKHWETGEKNWIVISLFSRLHLEKRAKKEEIEEAREALNEILEDEDE